MPIPSIRHESETRRVEIREILMTILEFHVRPRSGESYTLQVFARDSSLLASAEFDYPLSFMNEFEFNQLDHDPRDPLGRIERIREFGQRLYRKLFNADVERVWKQQKASSDFLVLCLRIAPEAAGLESVPWETLFDGREFIAAGATTGMSRLPLDIDPQDDLLPVPRPLKMLAFVASPLDLADNQRLQIEREQEILLEAVNTPAGQGRLYIDCEDEARLDILENSLEAGYNILHFTGHGLAPRNGGGLLLEDAQGKRSPASVADVIRALQKGKSTLRLAVISGCLTARTLHTGGFLDLARALARERIPAVIAMQFSISDIAGLQLAESLYPRLAAGQSIEAAMSAARRALLHSESPSLRADALAPVLLCASGDCLKTTDAPEAQPDLQPQIDKGFHVVLPQLSYGFYGRRREYRQIRDGLLFKNHRAVIVHGIGKTSLASHAATRLRQRYRGVYAFDCSGGLAPEKILLEMSRYFALQGVNALQGIAHESLPPEMAAGYLAQVLSQWPLLVIFDNFESQLEQAGLGFRIRDDGLRTFISSLVKATAKGSRFLFTSRYLFDLDEKRLGNIEELPLGDLSRPEFLGLMQKMQHLSGASFEEKFAAFDTFGGHPYAMVALDRHCRAKSLKAALEDAKAVHTELREFLALEMNYALLSERGRDMLNRLSAFRQPVPPLATEWVMGQKASYADLLRSLDRNDLPEEWREMDEAMLTETLDRVLPERRQAENLSRQIDELIGWGLLMPVYEDGQLETLGVHALVRDFCRDKQEGEMWRVRLRDAAAFYTNQTKMIERDSRTPAAIWAEMEAFELLMEAGDYEEASGLLSDATPILDRWGFGRYLEGQYHRLLNKVDRQTVAVIMHNLGVLHQDRGEYEAALAKYEESLKIAEELGDRAGVANSLHQIGNLHYLRGEYEAALAKYEESRKIAEELGNRAGVASSLHQIGQLFAQTGRYPEAFENLLFALSVFAELQSPNAQIAARSLKDLRAKWGADDFDAAWREAAGGDTPEWLK